MTGGMRWDSRREGVQKLSVFRRFYVHAKSNGRNIKNCVYIPKTSKKLKPMTVDDPMMLWF